MREMTHQELKEIQIEILNVVHDFCMERNIHYWIDCGTLLGAIRHKGYIPWDDDIDVGMLRPDYDRFCREFMGYSEQYQVVNIDNNPNFHCPYSKVVDTNTYLVELGRDFYVNIDVFVYDNAPDDDAEAMRQYDKKSRLWYLYCSRGKKVENTSSVLRNKVATIRNMLINLLPNAFFIRKIIKNAKRYAAKSTSRVGHFTGITRILCSKEVFSSFVDVEFEGKLYKAPAGYDEWLRAFYKDYMELPPIEKRKSHHSFKAYVKELDS